MAIYPFSQINARVFYACLGVLVKERNAKDGTDSPVDGTFLTGVSSVGIGSDFPSQSLTDIGRFQKKYHFYSPQSFEITIDRVIEQSSNFFYNIDPSNYTADASGYQACHVLNADNIGCQGETDPDGKSLKNYDVTILYGPDQFDRLGSDSGSGGDANQVFQVTYRNCLITAITYSMSIDGPITESITLITKAATYNEVTTTSSYTLPSAASAQSGNIIRRTDLDFLNVGSSLGTSYSVLPTEVTRMFAAKDSSSDPADPIGPINEEKSILGISSISVDISIEYSEVTDVGEWRGSIDQGEQNIWRYVVLPVQVTSSFTGTLRQPFPQDSALSSYLPNTDTTFSAANGSTSSTDWTKVDREIRIVAKKLTSPPNYFVWDLGKSNYLTNFSYDGGGVDGGNLEATMSYQNDASDIVLVRDTTVRDLPKPTNPY